MNGCDEHIEVLLPPPALQPVVICAVLRSVRLHAAPSPPSRVHANPYGSINLLRHGSIRLEGGERLPAAFVTGPLSRPVQARVEADLQAVTVVVQPWAVAPLTGTALHALVDRVAPLPAAKLSGARDALAALGDMRGGSGPGIEALWSALQRLLQPASAARPPPLALRVLRVEGVASAAQACGISERQYRRRFIAHMGLRPAAWVRLLRLESVMAGMLAAPAALSDLAAGAGYADQAHLSRDARALIGRSPKSLQRTLHADDVDWPLRVARPILSRLAGAGALPSRDDFP